MDVVSILDADLQIVPVPMELDVVRDLVSWQEAFPRTLNDGVIVASHVVHGTESVITSNGPIADHVPTIWD